MRSIGTIFLLLVILVLVGVALHEGILTADGGRPLPGPWFTADGGRPLPGPWLTTDGGRPLPGPWLTADGGRPLPGPWIGFAS